MCARSLPEGSNHICALYSSLHKVAISNGAIIEIRIQVGWKLQVVIVIRVLSITVYSILCWLHAHGLKVV